MTCGGSHPLALRTWWKTASTASWYDLWRISFPGTSYLMKDSLHSKLIWPLEDLIPWNFLPDERQPLQQADMTCGGSHPLALLTWWKTASTTSWYDLCRISSHGTSYLMKDSLHNKLIWPLEDLIPWHFLPDERQPPQQVDMTSVGSHPLELLTWWKTASTTSWYDLCRISSPGTSYLMKDSLYLQQADMTSGGSHPLELLTWWKTASTTSWYDLCRISSPGTSSSARRSR